MSELRIAQLANFVGPASGGMRTAVGALGRGYADAGCERLLVTPGACDHVEQTEHGTVVRLRAPQVGGGYRLIVQPWRVLDVLEEFAPTSVEVSDKSTLLPVTGWARRNRVGTVLLSHERLDAMVALRTGWETGVSTGVAVLNRLLTRRFDAVVVTSRFAADEFPRRTRHLVRRVPLGVDLDTFHPSAGRPADDGVVKLVHAGRLSREKSPHLAVATAVELHRRGLPIRLDVYGTGPHREELGAFAEGAPVVFHGHVAGRRALAARLAAADVALSVCPGETFGLAILEALGCGTPVVTAATGGGRELVDERCGGWPVGGEAASPAALADAVLRLVERDVRSLRPAARSRAEQFPWERAVDSMLAVHEQVHDQARARRSDVPA